MSATFFPNFFKFLTRKPLINLGRNSCHTIKKRLKVQTFCDININLPYHVNIKPLDFHKHHNLDEIKFELTGLSKTRKTIKHIQDGNNIKIFAGSEDYDENITCEIYAPIKSNLNITAKGNIHTGFFNGSRLILKSSNGSIYVDKYTGEQIDVCTNNGNITMKGAIVSANIKAQVVNKGSIKTKRLQGLTTHLKTNVGNISVDASYSDLCTFEANSGNMDLQNIHKNNKILLEKGNLCINGLDGQLDAQIQNGCADIQLSRILNKSTITIEEGDLILRLSEQCQEDTKFEILSKEHVLDPSIKSVPSKSDFALYLTPLSDYSDDNKHVLVTCKKSPVKIQSSSWLTMLKLNVQK